MPACGRPTPGCWLPAGGGAQRGVGAAAMPHLRSRTRLCLPSGAPCAIPPRHPTLSRCSSAPVRTLVHPQRHPPVHLAAAPAWALPPPAMVVHQEPARAQHACSTAALRCRLDSGYKSPWYVASSWGMGRCSTGLGQRQHLRHKGVPMLDPGGSPSGEGLAQTDFDCILTFM